MFIGHFGVGFGAKKINSAPSLGTYFLASQFIDLLWPLFLLLGIEKVIVEPGNSAFTPLNFIYYPFSHGLAGVLIWSILFGVIYYLIKKNLKASVLLAFLVLSHWILDFITHIPDLPIISDSGVKVGLGLWNSIPLTLVVEGLIFVLGTWFYMKTTKAENKKGTYAFWGLIIFLVLIYISNINSTPPEDPTAIAVVGFAQWLIILWGYWIDRNRKVMSFN